MGPIQLGLYMPYFFIAWPLHYIYRVVAMAKDFRYTLDTADRRISRVLDNVFIDVVVAIGYNRTGYK